MGLEFLNELEILTVSENSQTLEFDKKEFSKL